MSFRMSSKRCSDISAKMTSTAIGEDLSGITSLGDALNLIKFLKVSHKTEIAQLQETCKKQAKIIKKLECNRNQELSFLAQQLSKYERDLREREGNIARELAQKDEAIDRLNKTIESLQEEVKILDKSRSDSCDSGILTDKSELPSILSDKKKKHRPSFKSIFRNVDFSPKKSKSAKKMISFGRSKKSEKSSSEDEGSGCEDLVFRSHKIDESMTNHFCEEPSESEREKMFDRVMARTSVRRSSKNSKYQKISRNKAKHLGELKTSCDCSDSSS